MTVERIMFAFAGTMVLVSLALSQLHSLNWLWLTAFVGLNMFQAAFTGFCPVAKLFKKLGIKTGGAF
ncbi:MAG: DUF2892 domain-containing protein [Venatoribacter sp.]